MPKAKTKPTPAQTVGRNIRAARESAGLSVMELAGTLDTNPQTIYRWERGAKCPAVDTLAEVARACGTTVERLCQGI